MSEETQHSASAAPKSATRAAPTAAPKARSGAPHHGAGRGRARHDGGSGGDGATRSGVERTAELSDQVLEQVKLGQQAALEAVRKFMESVDRATPPAGEGPSRRHQVVDSALSMSQQLVKSEYDVLREIVRATGRALSDRRS